MSRNFELLTSLGEPPFLPPSPAEVETPAASVASPSRPRALRTNASVEELGLIQRLFLLPGLDVPRSIVFSGVAEEKESAVIAARISEILSADSSRKVCLVDGNTHAPSLHKRYGVELRPGLCDAIAEAGPIQRFVHQVGGSNLWLVPSGVRTADQRTGWSPERLQMRWSELRKQFDFVLTSAPALTPFADAIAFGRISDGVVLVLKENTTRRGTAQKVKENLEASNVRLLGAVLTHHTLPVPRILDRIL